ITINTSNLTLHEGGQIITQTFGTEGGNAGPIAITASNNIEITGAPIVDGYRAASEIISYSDGAGTAGDVQIHAGNLTIEEFGNISARGDTAKGGDISLAVNNLTLNAPGQDHSDSSSISSATFGAAPSGNVTITATGAVTLNGNGAYPQSYAAGNDM